MGSLFVLDGRMKPRARLCADTGRVADLRLDQHQISSVPDIF